MEGLDRAPETKSHEQEFPQAERLGYRHFRDVLFGDGDLMVGFKLVDFRRKKKNATSHAVIEGLHVAEGVPVGYCDSVQAAAEEPCLG